MNMNMNLNLKLDVPTLLKLGKRVGPSLIGLVIVGAFGYAGWVINQTFNVKAIDPTSGPGNTHITFDQKTIEAVKNLQVTSGQVAPAPLGTSDPFGN